MMDWLTEKFIIAGTKTAIVDKDMSFNYSQLAETIDAFFDKISIQIPAGEIVALLSDYSFYSIALFLSLAKNRNIIVPVLNTASDEETQIRLTVSRAGYVVSPGKKGNFRIEKRENKSVHPQVEKLQQDRVAGLILFSSGITGKPKAMVQNLSAIIEGFRQKKTNNLSIMLFLRFDHIGGLNTLLSGLAATSTLVLVESRKPENVCKLIETHKINVLPTTPTFLNLILISGTLEKYNISSLRLITYGTEYMPESLLKRLKSKLPQVRFIQTFGTSETGIMGTQSFSSDSNLIKISDDSVSYKIVDGILFLKSKTQVSGYLNQESDKFDDEGWFNTGDVVEETEDGYLRILSRKDEIINVGGEKVFPSEIENYLMKFSFILDCNVYGKPNAITGQSVAADLVIKDDVDAATAKKEIRKYFTDHVAPYKMPTKISFIENTEFNERFKKIRKAGHE